MEARGSQSLWSGMSGAAPAAQLCQLCYTCGCKSPAEVLRKQTKEGVDLSVQNGVVLFKCVLSTLFL